MAEYNLTLGEFWVDTIDWADRDRILAIYLLTCEHRLTEGLFRAPAHVVAYELAGDWTVVSVQTTMDSLVHRGWLAVDGAWVCITKALAVEHNRPASPSAIKGALARVKAAPRGGAAWGAFVDGAERWCPPLADVIAGRQVIAKHGRGLRLEPATPTTPVTAPVTEAVGTPVTAPVEGENPSNDGEPTTPVTAPVTAPVTSSTSFSPSLSPSLSVSTSCSTSSDLRDEILAAARAGGARHLARQADDPAEVKRVEGQLTLAGRRAAAATALVVEWLSRPGQQLDAKHLSILVPAAVRKIGESEVEAEVQRVERVDSEAEAAWSSVLEAMRGQVADETLDIWLRPLHAIALDAGRLIIGGERHIATWAKDRCVPLLTKVASELGVADAVEVRAAAFTAGAAA